MLIANAPCSWGIYYPDSGRISAPAYLDQVAAAGYRGTELGPLGFMPTDPAVLADALAARDLILIGAAHVHTFGDPDASTSLIASLHQFGALLRALDASHLAVMDEANSYPTDGPRELDSERWRRMTITLSAAHAMLAGDYGVTLSFHPHVGTCVEFERQIDRLLDDTPLDLCFDTGHHAFWDQDPLAYMARVRDRIAYIHLKNVDAAICARARDGALSIKEAFAQGAMCPLPDGAVDIPAVMRLLQETGFDGPVVVEQDLNETAAEPPAKLARRNLAYISALT